MNDDFDLDAFLSDIDLITELEDEAPVVSRSERRRMAEQEEAARAVPAEPRPAGRRPAAGPRPEARRASSEEPQSAVRREVRPEPREEMPRAKAPVTGRKPVEEAPRPAKKKSRFLPIYTIILAVLVIGTLVWLWLRMGNYQARVDAEAAETARQEALLKEEAAHAEAVHRAPQLAFESWRDSADAAYWTDLWYTQNPEGADGRDRVQEYLGQLFAPETLDSFRSLDSTPEAPAFVLKKGDETLAKATLSGSDVNWTVSDVRLLLKGDKSASIRVADGSTVFCNGKELDDSFITSSDSTFDCEELKDSLINPVKWNTYEVKGMLIEPELSATAPAGCNVAETAEGDFLLCLDSDSAANYINTSVNFVKKYFYYYLCGGVGLYDNYAAASAYLTAGTPGYQNLKDSLDGVYWDSFHSNIDTTDVTADSAVIWAENCYSVDVKYHVTGVLNTGDVETFDGVMRVFWLDGGESFYLAHYEIL